MKKKWWIIAAATIAGCIGLVLGVLTLLPPRPGVTKENFDRIEVGMARAEVEALFGAPAIGWPQFGTGSEWENEESGDLAMIGFDENGLVAQTHWDAWPDHRTPFEKFLDRLPWRAKPSRKLKEVE
jgi:hypothetical protein